MTSDGMVQADTLAPNDGVPEPERRKRRGRGRADAVEPLGAQQRPCSVVDLHLLWERQLAALGRIDLSAADEPAFLAVCERMLHLESLLLGTQARTLDGAMAQVRWVALSMAGRGEGEREQAGLRLALAALVSLRPGASRPLPPR
jgi:hypothetical protein